MQYENLTKEELIELLNKTNNIHRHKYEYRVDIENKKLLQICSCGYRGEELDLTMIESPFHEHTFKQIPIIATFGESKEKYQALIYKCTKCNELRIYLDNSFRVSDDDILNYEHSPKYLHKTEKTEMYYPKKQFDVVNFYGPIKNTYNGTFKGYVFYIKSSGEKWYKATDSISKYISTHYTEWTDETNVLFRVFNKCVV